MYILIACEESQAICREFRLLGHTAYSCDLQPSSGGHPEWHILGDCFAPMLHPMEPFYTEDGTPHFTDHWDLVIAHPPCTYLADCARKYLNVERYGEYAIERSRLQDEAAAFFMRFVNETQHISHLAIENPLGCMSRHYRKADQIIQPWWWGDPVQKSTCLWLRGLPPLVADFATHPPLDDSFFRRTRHLPDDERRRQRSKTFAGIAHAIATQWSNYLQHETSNNPNY